MFLFESENLKKEERLRFVLDDANTLFFDEAEKAPAKVSLYIPAQKSAFQQLLQMKQVDGVLLHITSDFEKFVHTQLKKSFLQAISLAKKANLLVVGLGQIQEYNAQNNFKAFILADDAGKDVSKRVHSWQTVLCHGVTSFELENALGLHNVSIVGVKDKKEASYLLNAHKKLKALENE